MKQNQAQHGKGGSGKQLPPEIDDLHMALKSCNEIGSARTLYQFLMDLSKQDKAVPNAKSLQQVASDQQFKQFLHGVILCTEQDYDPSILDSLICEQPRTEYKSCYIDLISKVVEELLVEKKVNKLQTFGYSLEQGQKENLVKCNYINLNKQCLITRNWERVYLILGDSVFKHIYKEYMIFLKTRDESLVQISGTNIFCYLNERLGRLQQAFYEGGGKEEGEGQAMVKKPQKVKYGLKQKEDTVIKKDFFDDQIIRNRLFYCAHMNRKNKFFQKHFLNHKTKTCPEITQGLMSHLFNFSRLRPHTSTHLHRLLSHFVSRQRTFNYNYYLQKNCALPSNWKEQKERLLVCAEGGPTERGNVYRELFDLSCDYRQVADFLAEVLFNLMPADFLEGKNKKVMNRKICQFVKFNRFESFTKTQLLFNFRIQEVGWLQGFNAKNCNKKYFMNENEWVFWRLTKWLFEDFFVSLCRCYFYVTEKQKEYSRIFYYRKNVWNVVMRLSIEDLLKQTLKMAKKEEMNKYCESQNFAPGKLRLIPKGDTFRPIMTFNRKVPQVGQNHQRNFTTNKKLQNAHMMLKNLKSKMFKANFGFPVFNYDDIMRKYEAFVTKWKQVGQPQLYFVAMDIEKCYDNVDQDKLSSFLQKTDLLDKEYFILNCFVLKRKNNIFVEKTTFKKASIRQYFRYKFQKIGIDGSAYPSLFEVLEDEFNDLNIKRTLIVEQEQRRKFLKNDLLTPIFQIAKNNFVTFNKKQYVQTKGIPQGLCVSYILSSFYYANLEENVLQFLRRESLEEESPELNLLMRLTDDYLLITTEKNNAMLFIEKLYNLSSTNYFKFNMKKLKTNFVLNLAKLGGGKGDESNIDKEFFNWIGITIDMSNLNIVPNINTKKEGILCTLNINMQTKESVMWLKRKLKSFLMNNVSFYFRKTINERQSAEETLYKIYISAVEKYVACAWEFKQFHANSPFSNQVDLKITQVIYVVIRAFFKYLVCNVRNGLYSKSDYKEFFRLSVRCFEKRFKCSRSQFDGVYRILKNKQAKVQNEDMHFIIK